MAAPNQKKKPTLRARLDERQQDLLKQKRRAAWLLGNWWKLAIGFLALYVALPIAAPVLMHAGATGPANVLYTVYSPMCHQFAFRSVFLFGEQTAYPRQAADTDYGSFEEYAANSERFREIYTRRRQAELRDVGSSALAEGYAFQPQDLLVWDQVLQFSAREFRGDETFGYKIALCQRDIMIYGTMLLAAIGFAFVRHRLRPAPLLLYLLLGIVPIGLDGFSQLFGYPPFNTWPLFDAWTIRETAPHFRYLTGALFGLMNVWLAFPYIHNSAMDNVARLNASIADTKHQQRTLDRELGEK